MTERATRFLAFSIWFFRSIFSGIDVPVAKAHHTIFTRFSHLAAGIVTGLCLAFPASANTCDLAARKVAAETGVPLWVLWSITRTETGRSDNGKLRPWPWTVNLQGDGHWFETEPEARAFVVRRFERGVRNFDIGCFQINYRWHGASFRSIEHMFDPLENARYAASFLKRLHRESGDWSVAAGAYHSRTPEYANRYRARFERIRNKFQPTPDGDLDRGEHLREYASADQAPRQNTYPLLMHSSNARSHGSLVPLAQNQTSALFSIPKNTEGS